MGMTWVGDGVAVGRKLGNGKGEVGRTSEGAKSEISGPDQKPVGKVGNVKS